MDCQNFCKIIDDILQGRRPPENFFREQRGNKFPGSYIGLPPSPPSDLGGSSQVQLIQTPKEQENLWDKPYCKHCGEIHLH